ncbi:MAG TPA: Maf family protein [Acidobacteriota bacterium]|nr:Maf family protein [Acidobacteriota bacterium]
MGKKPVTSGRRPVEGTQWILASASPRRKEILRRLGISFTADPRHVHEPPRRPKETAARYVIRLSRLKAEKAAGNYESGIVLAADTVVVSGRAILGKPVDRGSAAAMLRRLSGRWHEVVSGICLIDCGKDRVFSASCLSRVHFRRMSRKEIEWYLDTNEFHDKAGAYGIQGYASLFIDRIEGCYFNIVGFPVSTFEKLCRKAGIDLPGDLANTVGP